MGEHESLPQRVVAGSDGVFPDGVRVGPNASELLDPITELELARAEFVVKSGTGSTMGR